MTARTAKGRSPVEVGAVLEVPTSRGFGYLQYTHWNDLMGALVRVLPRLHVSRPTDLAALVDEPEAYVTFVPLHEAIKAGFFEVIGSADVPERARPFPLFRVVGARAAVTGEPLNWWLWDGKKEWRLDALSPDQSKLSVRSTLMPPALIQRLEAGWRPGQPKPTAPSRAHEQTTGGVEPQVRHYLYFPDEGTARRAAAALVSDDMQAVVEPSARGVEWLVLASGGGGQTLEETRMKLERVASKLRGEYDGWEAG